MSTPEEAEQRRIGGRYLLSAQLGSGAMGTVWSGYDEVLQRRVAVKELKVPPGIPEREALAMRERMLREARALGGLSHPNVITVYDVVDVGGEPLVVLEMLPSRNLATMIAEQGSLNARQAAVVGFATAAALRAAHRAGITHRDVKPGNVLVADDGRVKLTDFGIARNAADAPMTTAGLVLGSPAYIAPEVAAGQAVTPAADLWGLGATLFAAIEGRPPYDVRGDPVSTITEVVDGDVPRPRDAGPVSEVIAALMVKEPERRMPLEEVRQRLRPLLADPDDPLYPGSPDAPTLSSMLPPRPSPVAPPRRADNSGGVSTSGPQPNPVAASAPPRPAVPLAAAPGPLPVPPGTAGPSGSGAGGPTISPTGPPRTVVPPVSAIGGRAAAGPSPEAVPGWWSVLLVVAGAVVLLLGTAGGWAVTRALSGQSPLTTVTVTTDRAELVRHTDPLGFTVGVPEAWTQYRYETDGGTRVSFVSPDGTEEFSTQRFGSVDEVATGLTATGLGVDGVEFAPPDPKAAIRSGQQELSYRTEEGSLHRTTWLRVVPAADGVWAVRLTVPADRSDSTSADLFTALATGFTPNGA
ncbi:protein kinase domain-containing protein [Pseudonocardia bannensis]|uniref:non-specific serine/threonine protein kinase n=1 Tax=Pseudonocardia bannensis TaxID=630973 RepID=A0A848DPC1_9PSEU|nr:serine/threonine-protein kinase [Pseudonocardia bannensis]NMH94588.1 protein kinase [Pseudonocardia bannensis]